LTVTEQTAGAAATATTAPLLEVRDLHVEFHTRDGVARAVNGVSYAVNAGETLAVLGESGSGKSVTAQAIMGILDTPPGFVTGGAVRFRGEDILQEECVTTFQPGSELSNDTFVAPTQGADD